MTNKQKRTALLISGGVNKAMNYSRYRNDLERWCLALQARGFDCAICFADGTGMTVTGARVRSAQRQDIDAELAYIAGLDKDDLAVVLVSNHGDATGFCTWGSADRISPSDLAQALRGCTATKILVLGQCHGGAFGSMALSDTVVITACGADESSWACAHPPGKDAYDEFLYQLAEALFGPPPQTLTSGDPHPAVAPPAVGPSMMPVTSAPTSLRAAFDQAVARDRRPESPTITDANDLAKTLVLG